MSIKFEVVKNDARTAYQTKPSVEVDEKVELENGDKIYVPEINLPTYADDGSAGCDFYSPISFSIMPKQKTIIFTDVKAKMPKDVVLLLFIRSSLAVKNGLMLSNNVGVIDSTYYGNEANDGNIGIPLVNTTGKTVEIKAGERIAQGVFVNYLKASNTKTADTERKGGFGSSGK